METLRWLGLCCLVLFTATSVVAVAAGIPNCDALKCFGKPNYKSRCEGAKKEFEAFKCGPAVEQPCKSLKEEVEEQCGCATTCMHAVCAKWPANKNPQDACYEASYR